MKHSYIFPYHCSGNINNMRDSCKVPEGAHGVCVTGPHIGEGGGGEHGRIGYLIRCCLEEDNIQVRELEDDECVAKDQIKRRGI